MPKPAFLICFHTASNTGYAIEPLEITFYEVIREISGSSELVHLGYRNFNRGRPKWAKGETDNFVALDYSDTSNDALKAISEYIRKNNIQSVLAFDLGVGAGVIKAFRGAGVKHIISYYGAPMSSIHSGVKLLFKRTEVFLTRNKPTHYIFESCGMQKTATHGRGVRTANTSVVRLGIDVDSYSAPNDRSYVYRAFGIPFERRIVFYAGHMEERKGVRVIIKAAAELVNKRHFNGLHFLICGNRHGEEAVFDTIFKDTEAENFVTFGGYRDDIPQLMAGCYAAVIPSTGWDSFPRSSLEMAAAGLPLLVSDLPGLNETILDGVTGLLFRPGDHSDLADKLLFIYSEPEARDQFSSASVRRVLENFTLDIQKQNLRRAIQSVVEP
jgi:glycosyltransferase involved in cell wall biosynthesis